MGQALIIIREAGAHEAVRSTIPDKKKWKDAHDQCFMADVGPLRRFDPHEYRPVLKFKEQILTLLKDMSYIHRDKQMNELPSTTVLELADELWQGWLSAKRI